MLVDFRLTWRAPNGSTPINRTHRVAQAPAYWRNGTPILHTTPRNLLLVCFYSPNRSITAVLTSVCSFLYVFSLRLSSLGSVLWAWWCCVPPMCVVCCLPRSTLCMYLSVSGNWRCYCCTESFGQSHSARRSSFGMAHSIMVNGFFGERVQISANLHLVGIGGALRINTQRAWFVSSLCWLSKAVQFSVYGALLIRFSTAFFPHQEFRNLNGIRLIEELNNINGK